MVVERRRLVRGLKIWVDVLFFLALAGSAIVLVFWPISRVTEGVWQDMGIPVEINETSLRPVRSLAVSQEALEGEMAAGEPSSLDETLGLTPPLRLVEVKGELRVLIDRVTPGLVFWLLLAISAGIGILALHLLRRILATTAEGQPFHPSNVKRLNLLGWLLVTVGAFEPLAKHFYSRWILNQLAPLTGTALHPPVDLDGNWILAGLLLLVLASVWKEAVRMAEEQSLTV